jgi:hypothetical protein
MKTTSRHRALIAPWTFADSTPRAAKQQKIAVIIAQACTVIIG